MRAKSLTLKETEIMHEMLNDLIRYHTETFAEKPKTIVLSYYYEALFIHYFRIKYGVAPQELVSMEGIKIIWTPKENVMEVF